jgi:hypothetical protein
MTLKGRVLAFVIASVLAAAGVSASAALLSPDSSQETGPVYSLEGAWYGITTFPGTPIPPTPTLDTFVSNAQRRGVEGTFLCTIPAEIAGGQTPSGHGNWVRIATNRYAFTAMRARMDGAAFVGWVKFWGTITPASDDELTGTINAQFLAPDGTPASPPFPGTLERHRIGITFEQ